MIEIKVPASSANIGPGFDSLGIALGKYLTLRVKRSDRWKFTHTGSLVPPVRSYQDHYIYKVVIKVAKKYRIFLPPCEVEMHSEIPLARGLGSSASAIIAGIELVNQFGNLQLSTEEKLTLAVEIEGHPDNVSPALFGGLMVTVQIDGKTSYTKISQMKTDLVLYIPDYELKTTDARSVLPASLQMDTATTASAVSNVMLAALLSEDYQLAGDMMEKDMFHEIYRNKLLPDYTKTKQAAKKYGAYGTVISGAGPTMLSFVPQGSGNKIARHMQSILPNAEVTAVPLDFQGLRVAKV
ncbi:MAG TPA: homoserine kinase [Pseudogracilibacillus sp.]|nr:homoserine kinase [Pseudogracilibacillus sp.]